MSLQKLFVFLLSLSLWLVAPVVERGQIAIAFPAAIERPVKPTDLKILQNAHQTGQSNLQVLQEGKVVKVLPDDNYGSRHQRFLLQLASGQTLLIAHNIDLALRLPNLQVGDKVRFYGEYEWNNKGGTVHWTHRDPQGRHINGWLEYKGKRYQ